MIFKTWKRALKTIDLLFERNIEVYGRLHALEKHVFSRHPYPKEKVGRNDFYWCPQCERYGDVPQKARRRYGKTRRSF